MIRFIIIILILLIACEDARDWDNPYDPRSNREFWSPVDLSANNEGEGVIKLTWLRKGRRFDGFVIDRKFGDDNWKDYVKIIKDTLEISDDSEYSFNDSIDLKILVNKLKIYNPLELKYRIYAYAVMENGDTNKSNFSSFIVEPDAPSNPDTVKIQSIKYEFPKKLTVTWGKSTKNFNSYLIYHSFINDFENKTLYKSIFDKDVTLLDTSIFTVIKENWFWVGIEDSMGQKTILENSLSMIPIDAPPESVVLDSITYDNNKFNLKWSIANMKSVVDDFSSYIIEEVTLPDSLLKNIEIIDNKNEVQKSINIEIDNEKHYRIKLNDHWGNTSVSN